MKKNLFLSILILSVSQAALAKHDNAELNASANIANTEANASTDILAPFLAELAALLTEFVESPNDTISDINRNTDLLHQALDNANTVFAQQNRVRKAKVKIEAALEAIKNNDQKKVDSNIKKAREILEGKEVAKHTKGKPKKAKAKKSSTKKKAKKEKKAKKNSKAY